MGEGVVANLCRYDPKRYVSIARRGRGVYVYTVAGIPSQNQVEFAIKHTMFSISY